MHLLEILVERLADIAVDAAQDLVLPAALHLLRPVGVGEQLAGHADQVGLALLQQRLGIGRVADLADGDDGHLEALGVDIGLDRGRQMGVRQGRVQVAGHAAVAGIAGIGIERLALAVHRILELAAHRQRNVIDPALRHAQGYTLRVLDRVAVLDRLFRQEPHADGEARADGAADRRHHPPEHRQAALQGAGRHSHPAADCGATGRRRGYRRGRSAARCRHSRLLPRGRRHRRTAR